MFTVRVVVLCDFFFSSRRRHTRLTCDWSSDVCSSDLSWKSVQHPQFWPILARFMDYYSQFWGPGLISTIDEPRGGFTCRSSTLAVLADSVTVLGTLSDFHD